MKRKTAALSTEEEILFDLTHHNLPASLVNEFAQKIVMLYYQDNLNAAIQDLMQKALIEEETVLSHITQIREHMEA